MKPLQSFLASLMVSSALGACSSPSMSTTPTPPLQEGKVLTTNATVRFVNIEGGCWALETASGERYEPTNLAAQYRTNGLEVRVVLRDAPDIAGICQMAPFVTIDSISIP